MKALFRWVEILLVWLLPPVWMIFCSVQFNNWEPTPEYTNAGGFLLLAAFWLFELRFIRRSLASRRYHMWAMAATFCVVALLSGLLFFIIIPAKWAAIWVMIVTGFAAVMTMPGTDKKTVVPVKSANESGRVLPSVVITMAGILLVGGAFTFYLLNGPTGSLKRQQLRAFFGSVDDQLALGWRYREGEGVPQDFTRAASWFEKAANAGSAKAQYDIGVLSYYGLGTGESSTKARNWFDQASRQDYAPAVTMLGLIAQDEKDLQSAIQLWQRAVSLNDRWAEYLLGSAYLRKQSTSKDVATREKDLTLALYWLEKARRDGAEPIGGMLRHVWSTVPAESLPGVTDKVLQGLEKGVAP